MAHRWPSRSPRLFTLASLALVSFFVIASIAGCASSTNANGAETGNTTATATPSSAPTSAATSAPTTCNQVLGFAQAGPPPQAGALLGSIPFPGNSVFTSLAHVAGGTAGLYEVQWMHVCTANTSVSAIHRSVEPPAGSSRATWRLHGTSANRKTGRSATASSGSGWCVTPGANP